MVYFPARKCYHAVKVTFLLVLVIAVLALFEQWRGGKRGSSAFTEPAEVEFERQILEDEARIVPGLGEGGVAAYLTGEDKKRGEESEKKLAMNVYLSDRISYNRTLKDHRNPACKRVLYDAELPSASVILIFHNEPYSVVVRTIWSVINSCRRTNKWFQQANFVDNRGRPMKLGYPGQDPNSPLVYLKEIILVDDNSTLPELKGKLSHYVRTRLPPDLIRILRLPDRVGLTRARLAGARYAVGDVLVFLDSHCEAQPDWLRPQLQAIKDDRHAVTVPIIDVIDSSNFYYSVQDPVTFQGLMQARIVGARAARGEVLIFLDAHCEAEEDWMRPLLQRIRHKRDAVLTPIIDVIDQTGFQLDTAENFQVGGFTFTGHFTWIDVPEREKKRRGSDIAPTWSPTMAGGLFAINRAYYWELGAYDEQMAGWGGENLEMSFRIWQCGGTLETIPCSRVGHVFRSFHPYGLPEHTDTHGVNTARMAEVWMDEYAELFYLHRPDLRNNPKIGDVTHRKVLREKLQCKSFQWYLDNIYKEKFVPVRDAYGYGRFQNPSSGLCLDTLQREAEEAALGLYQCHAGLQATQYLILSLDHELRGEDDCAHAMYKRRSSQEIDDFSRKVLMSTCRGKKSEKKWTYNPVTEQIQHSDDLCLDAGAGAGADVLLRPCTTSAAQRWRIDYSEDNDFRMSNDIEPNEQQLKLSRLRGQKRISRSLLSYSNANSLPNATVRRHTHKKHKKRNKKSKKTKNKFILKLVRSLTNNSEEHLEVDIHCKHKQLYPNNTFVRDLVSILNEKNIKVINNGRVFERNKVTQLESGAPDQRVLNKMDIVAQQAPPSMQAIEQAVIDNGRVFERNKVTQLESGAPDQRVLNKMDIVAQQAPPSMQAIEQAVPAGAGAAPAPWSLKPLEMTPHRPPGAAPAYVQHSQTMSKKTHKKLKLPVLQPLPAGAGALAGVAPPPAPDEPTADNEPRAHRIIIEDFVELTPANTARPKRVKKRKRGRGTAAPEARATDEGDLMALFAQKLPPNMDDQIGAPPQSSEQANKESSEGESPMQLLNSERRAHSEEADEMSRYRANSTGWRRQRHRGRADPDTPPEEPARVDRADKDEEHAGGEGGEESASEAVPSPVKVVMRSNLTFNLGDEFFQWQRGDTPHGPSTEQSVAVARAAPPVHAWRRGDDAARADDDKRRDSDDDSSASDSNSSSD